MPTKMSEELYHGGTTFGHCKKHGDYCGSSCPFCQIDEVEKVLRDHIEWHKTPTYMSKVDEKGELDKQLEKLEPKC